MQFSRTGAAALTAVLMVAPSFAAADTISDLQGQIQALLAQVRNLQVQLQTLRKDTASSTPGHRDVFARSSLPQGPFATSTPPGQRIACMQLSRSIRRGDQGDDVRELQDMLREHGDLTASSTGFFGPLTAQAMLRWQMRMGIASSTAIDGSVGPQTRAFFARQCGTGEPLPRGDNNDDNGSARTTGSTGFGFSLGRIIDSILPHDVADAAGTIMVADASHMVLTLPSGSKRTVLLTSSTTISVFNASSTQLTPGTTADLVIGRTARAVGTKNTDDSITARDVKVGTPVPPPRPLPPTPRHSDDEQDQ